MSYFRSSLLVSIFMFCFMAAWAQNGTLKGKFTEAANGEPVPFATVLGPNGAGTTTDFDGNYKLSLPAGTHQIKFSYVGFTDSTYTVTIKSGEETILNHKAETQTVRLGVTTVVGGKFKKELGEEIVTVEVLNRNIIDNSSAFKMDEAMEKVPGVTIVDGQANIRGGSGWSYGAGSRVLVLVDDIPLMTADAADVKWSFIPTENVEQVEVVKGAASALYGSSALNGVINVVTAWPKNEPYTKAIMYTGFTENPRHKEYVWWGRNQPLFGGGNIVHRQKFGQFDFVMSASYNATKSHLEGGSNQEVRTSFKLRHRAKKIPGLSYGVNLNAYNSTGSTFFLWNGIDSSIYRPLPGTISEYSTLRFTADPFVTYFDKHDNRYKFTGRYFNALNTNNTGQGSLPQLFYGEFQYQRRFVRSGINVVAGVAGYHSDVRPPGDEPIDSSLVGQHQGNNVAVYAQLEKKFFQKLTIGFGVRYEYFTIDTFESDALPVFRFGINYQAAEATFIRASIGQGYRFPTIAEKFVNTNVGAIGIYPNPGLQPETGWSAELGVKQGVKLGEWLGYVDVAGFINQYDNMMEFTFGTFGGITDPLFGLGFSSQNIGKTRILGMELTLLGQGKIGGKLPLQILAGYTYIDPRSLNWDDTLNLVKADGSTAYFAPAARDGAPTYAGTSSSETNVLKYRFRHTIKMDVQLSVKKFDFGASLQYTSFMENVDYLFVSDFIIDQEDFGTLGDTKAFSGLKEYREKNHRGNTQFDLRLGYNLSDKINLLLICKNVLNQDIMERPAYMSQPRNYTAQISVTF